MSSPLKNKKLFCTYHHRYNIKKCMKHKSSVGIPLKDFLSAVNWLKKELSTAYENNTVIRGIPLKFKFIEDKIDLAFEDVTKERSDKE